jgi:uncharacterized protein YabN with tetrapyrrole methylase and pyrophosphatase domain
VDDLVQHVVGRIGDLLSAHTGATREQILGDLLFKLTNMARLLGIDAESALREANVRFEEHFRKQEQS